MKLFFLKIALLLATACTSGALLVANETPAVATLNAEKAIKERILWGVPISPYVRVVLVTLNEKKLPYTHKKIFPTVALKAMNQEIDPNFAKASPFGKIPAYEEISENGSHFALAESVVIAEYIDDVENSHPLRPKCPKANARVSFFIAYGGNTLAPLTHELVFENVVKPSVLKESTDMGKIEKILHLELPVLLDYLEHTLSDGRSWIAGTQDFSLADIVITSHLATLDFTNLISAVNAIGKDRPHLMSYYQKVVARESFKKAMSD